LIVLDTHAWVWWLDDPRKLPARARKAVNEAAADEAVYISTISTWEIMLLASGGRLEFRMRATGSHVPKRFLLSISFQSIIP